MSEKTTQVLNQYRVVAEQGRIISKLAEDHILFIAGDNHSDRLLGVHGKISAEWMEMLGNMLNSVDANSDDDEWMDAIFAKAHELFPMGKS